MKIRIVATILMLICITGYTNTMFNGYDWMTWTYERQIGYVQGAISENIMLLAFAAKYGIDREIILALHINGKSYYDILNEITEYYINTEDYDTPLYIVIHIRNDWRIEKFVFRGK